MIQLTDSQRDLLRAINAGEGCVPAATILKRARPLVRAGLLMSVDRTSAPASLILTDAGRAAIADSAQTESKPRLRLSAGDTTEASGPPTPKGKVGVLIAKLGRSEGATLAELTQATGWQAHSVRGAISGAIKKKLGLTVISEVRESGRVYRLVEGAR